MVLACGSSVHLHAHESLLTTTNDDNPPSRFKSPESIRQICFMAGCNSQQIVAHPTNQQEQDMSVVSLWSFLPLDTTNKNVIQILSPSLDGWQYTHHLVYITPGWASVFPTRSWAPDLYTGSKGAKRAPHRASRWVNITENWSVTAMTWTHLVSHGFDEPTIHLLDDPNRSFDQLILSLRKCFIAAHHVFRSSVDLSVAMIPLQWIYGWYLRAHTSEFCDRPEPPIPMVATGHQSREHRPQSSGSQAPGSPQGVTFQVNCCPTTYWDEAWSPINQSLKISSNGW